jgi:hypothetical protein
MVDKQESYKIRRIQTDGKSNAWFYKKPQEKRKSIGNMTINDASTDDDKNNGERTNDVNNTTTRIRSSFHIIGSNFARKFSEIYRRKEIDPEKLEKLMGNIDWNLTE